MRSVAKSKRFRASVRELLEEGARIELGRVEAVPTDDGGFFVLDWRGSGHPHTHHETSRAAAEDFDARTG